MPAGYSGTPLIKKLGIKLSNFVHAFVTQHEELAKLLKKCREVLPDDGMVWISWPKRASKVATTITEDIVRELALPLGFVDIKVCAVSEIWSGLKLVVRKELRTK